MKVTILFVLMLISASNKVFAQESMPTASCNSPMGDPISYLNIGDHPTDPIPTRDGCWIFLSVTRSQDASGVAILKRSGGKVTPQGFIYIPGTPFGMVLSHDENTLIVAARSHVAFLNVEKLKSGGIDPIEGFIGDDIFVDATFANITSDDKYVFVSQEGAASIAVIDFSKARADGFNSRAILGNIPTGYAPLSLVFSPDERFLYATSQEAPPSYGWPIVCKPQSGLSTVPDHTEGAVLVIDVNRAKSAPASSVLSSIHAGCNPVRLALSLDSNTAYVSARSDGKLMAFDTRKFMTQPNQSLIGTVPVGTAPVGVEWIDEGKKIVVANSNRYVGSADDKQSLTVIDASRIREGAAAVLGAIPARAFPRQMHRTSDGRTLLLTNYNSGTLEIIDVTRLRIN